jgi:hypothetical protein
LLTLSLSRFFILQVGGMEGFWLIDSGCSRHMTGDRWWFSSLTSVMTKEYITFGDNGKGRVLSVGTVKVSESVTLRRVSLVKSWVTIFSLFPNFLMRVLRYISKWVVLVFWILEAILCVRSSPRVKFSEPIFLSVLALLVV